MTQLVSQLRLVADGPQVSRLVAGLMRLGEWGLDPAQRLEWIKACLALGITTFDHADIYGGYTCEALFGEALALEPSIRQQMQLVSKCGINLITPNRPHHHLKSYNTRPEHIVQSAENSLRNLHTDYLDLLLIHRPSPLMDADEIAEAFATLKQAGKVLHFGVSNFTPWQFDLLQARLDFPLVTNQVELSPLQMAVLHDGTLDQAQQHRFVPMIWSPLAGGSIFHGETEQAQRVQAALRQVGEALDGATPDQVALAWVMHHPARPVLILGTGKLDRIRVAVAAEALTLTDEQWFAIWQASIGHEVP